jgi:hypothetical protein
MAAKFQPALDSHGASETAPRAPERSTGEGALLPHAYLARLAALRDEASETAHLANLLGRAPWIAGGLCVAAIGWATIRGTAGAGLAVWLLLVAAAAIAILRGYGRGIRAPFERPALQSFTHDLSAALLYAGFAWGAGIFLALPVQSGPLECAAFVGGIAVFLAGLLRAREIAFFFVVPATGMTLFAALMRPSAPDPAIFASILAGGAAAAASAALVERRRKPEAPGFRSLAG